MFQSTKVFEGFSCCFRQWRATHSHCQFLHSYVTKIQVIFEGGLDEKNWVQDFGSFKANGVNDKLKYWFDHTTLVAADDPELAWFVKSEEKGILQLRVLPKGVGAERYAEFAYEIISKVVHQETQGRVKVAKVEFFEHEKNSAIFTPEHDYEQVEEKKEEEMLSLYDFLGRAGGSEMGKMVAEKAQSQNIRIGTRWISNPGFEGNVILYPKSFLQSVVKK